MLLKLLLLTATTITMLCQHNSSSSLLSHNTLWNLLEQMQSTCKQYYHIRPAQNGNQLSNSIFKCISSGWKCLYDDSNFIEVYFVFDNKSALFHIIAWCCLDDKPLPEPMLTRFCDALWNSVTGPPCFNPLRPRDAYMRHQTCPSLVQIMACRLVGAKPLSEPMLEYC